jgi:NAD kinase
MASVLAHLRKHYPSVRLIVEPHTAKDHPGYTDLIVTQRGDEHLLGQVTSLVLTIGGDGTILHVSHLFSTGECPPVVSFSMGSLGFLLPFREWSEYTSRDSAHHARLDFVVSHPLVPHRAMIVLPQAIWSGPRGSQHVALRCLDTPTSSGDTNLTVPR